MELIVLVESQGAPTPSGAKACMESVCHQFQHTWQSRREERGAQSFLVTSALWEWKCHPVWKKHY